ncbi:TPA: glycosyltransferase family 2 protein [Vibrio cholerae]|nr:putative glycosyltransferase [Vibrio cholerae]GHZ12225.1 Beta-1, 3-glucosyltransferase [Vibrio cholerae]
MRAAIWLESYISEYMSEVSIVIPTYNNAEKLERTISLINNKELKIIVIDDGSNMNNRRINEEICRKNNILYQWFANSGPSKARYIGLRFVETPFVVFLDCDDYISYDAISIAIKHLKQNDSSYLVFRSTYISDFKNIKKLESELGVTKVHKIKSGFLPAALAILGMGFSSKWNQSNTVYKCSHLKSVYKCRSLTWAEDIPLKVMIMLNLAGEYWDCNRASFIEISYGRGYIYKYSQVIDLVKEIATLQERSSLKHILLSFICLIRFSLSYVYKQFCNRLNHDRN